MGCARRGAGGGRGGARVAWHSGVGSHLDGVNVVRDDDELRLLLLAQLGDVVDAELDADRLLLRVVLAGLLLLGIRLQALLLALLVLGPVLVQQLEQVDGQVAVERVLELVDRGRHLQSLVQHLALTLDAHILRPLDIAAEVAARLNVLTDAKVLGLLLPNRAGRSLLLLGLLRVLVRRRRRHLLALGSLARGWQSRLDHAGGVLCKGVHERLCCATGGGDRDAALKLKLTSASRLARPQGRAAQSTQLSLPALQWDGRSGGLLGSRAGAAGLQAERTRAAAAGA